MRNVDNQLVSIIVPVFNAECNLCHAEACRGDASGGTGDPP